MSLMMGKKKFISDTIVLVLLFAIDFKINLELFRGRRKRKKMRMEEQPKLRSTFIIIQNISSRVFRGAAAVYD